MQRVGAALAIGLVVAGCASSPPRGAAPSPSRSAPSTPSGDAYSRGTDGPGANPPADLAAVPDAEPRVEPIRPSGGTSKPYQALGRDYVPINVDAPFRERGLASWYGRKFHGLKTASGETYDMYAMTAAHPTLPLPSYARIRNPANGRVVIVRVNDRGPFHAGRIVDLSYVAALKLDLLRGVAPVELERITLEEIRTGAWRRDGDGSRVAGAPGRVSSSVGVGVSASASARAAAPAADIDVVAPPPVAAGNAPVVLATSAPATTTATVAAVVAPAAVTIAPATDAPLPMRAANDAARGFWIQLGAFRERDGAQNFQRRVGAESDAGWLAPQLATFADAALYRVQAGPYPSRDEAEGAAARVRASLGLVPLIVERR